MGIPPSQGKFHPKLPRKMRPRNMFGDFLSTNDQKSFKIWPGWHVQNLGDAFFLEKNRRRQPTPEHMGFIHPNYLIRNYREKCGPGTFLVIFCQKMTKNRWKFGLVGMSKIWGLLFSWKKTAGGSLPRSTWVFCPAKSRMACMAWLLGKDQSWQNKHFTKTWFWSWLGSIWLQIEFWPAPWAGNFEPELMKGAVCLQISQNMVKYVGIRPGF